MGPFAPARCVQRTPQHRGGEHPGPHPRVRGLWALKDVAVREPQKVRGSGNECKRMVNPTLGVLKAGYPFGVHLVGSILRESAIRAVGHPLGL